MIIPTEGFKQTGEITETVLYDRNGVKITATGLSYNSYKAELELNIENNTSTDLDIHSGTWGYCRNSVNGYMLDGGYLSCSVSAGKKANDTIDFSYDSLRVMGITEIADIEIAFDIDASDYSDDSFEEIYTEPCAIKTSAADSYDYSADAFYKAMNG
ncbi:MAG: catabolite control protein A, partial [Ruminococcus sp.]|nr:catabolite control protein A [Ruminococcus sp.]